MTIRNTQVTSEKPIPPISKELVEWLESAYPDRCPVKGMTTEDVWMAAGAAQVVRKIRHAYSKLLEQEMK